MAQVTIEMKHVAGDVNATAHLVNSDGSETVFPVSIKPNEWRPDRLTLRPGQKIVIIIEDDELTI